MKTGDENENQKPKERSNDDLLKIIQKQNEQFEALSKEIVEIKKSQNNPADAKFLETLVEKLSAKTSYQASEDDKEIMPPEDDYNEVGVRFCAPFVGYFVNDDFRKNRRVKLPFNKPHIFFDYASTRRVGQGRFASTAPYSVYTSHSELEIQWLRDHSNYDIMFFESSTEAANAKTVQAIRLSSIMSTLRDYELNQLIQVARENKVPYNEDIHALRINVATKLSENQLALEEKRAKEQVSETYKSVELLKTTGLK